MKTHRRAMGGWAAAAFVMVGLLFLLVPVSPASADSISFDLGNVNISGFTGPYVHVVIDRTDSTHATITFTSITQPASSTECNGGPCTFLLGGQGQIAVNVNATSFTVGSITGSTDTTASAAQEDGWGTFNLTLDNTDGFTKATSSVSFVVTNTEVGGSWATASDVLTGNEGGSTAAAHIFVSSCTDTAGTTIACNTGYAANGNPVPEPATLLLVGSALAGLGAWTRRRRRGGENMMAGSIPTAV